MRTCDGFVIIKVTTPDEVFYRLFTCIYGGYLDGDSWRLNSGIVKIEEDDTWIGEGKAYLVHGQSSSIYLVHENQYEKLTGYCWGVLDDLISQLNGREGYSYVLMDVDEYLEDVK